MKPPRSRRFAFILIVWALAVILFSATVSAAVARCVVMSKQEEVLKRIEEIKQKIEVLTVPEAKKSAAIIRVEEAARGLR